MARSGGHKSAPARERARLSFHAIGAAGDGIAEFNGRTIYAPGAAPGDVALADIASERAEIVEFIERSALRREPECPHVTSCGGCALQHLAPESYSEWKRERVAAALARAGVEALVRAPILIPPATRRRATFAVRRKGRVTEFGFNARRSSAIAAIDQCKILHPDVLRALPQLQEVARRFTGAFDLQATLCDNGLDVNIVARAAGEPSGGELAALIKTAESGFIARLSLNGASLFTLRAPVVAFDGVVVAPPPGTFLQASREGEAALFALVREATSGAKRIADLFSGCGTFALPLARRAEVAAFDQDKDAIAALQAAGKKAQGAGLSLGVKGAARDLFELPLSARDLSKFDAIVFDPPRAGARAQAVEIAKSDVALVIGVSCSPDSFARDTAILSQGGLKLIEATPVDQFVYAPHIELVGVFRRR